MDKQVPPSEWVVKSSKCYINLKTGARIRQIQICPKLTEYYRLSIHFAKGLDNEYYADVAKMLGGQISMGLNEIVWFENIIHPNDIHGILDKIDKIESIYPIEMKNKICLDFGSIAICPCFG